MAKRLTGSKINWTGLAERVPPNQKSNFLAFKTRSDSYLRKMLQYPEQPPTIDWAYYQKKIAIPGLVETFKKGYEGLSVPYPKDTVSTQIDAQEKEVKEAIAQFVAASNKNIATVQAELDAELAKIATSEMTIEEYYQAYPDKAIDTFNRPTYWPHFPEDQPGYVDKDAPPKEAH